MASANGNGNGAATTSSPVVSLARWSTEKKAGYSPNEFYTTATDRHGHRSDVRLMALPQMVDEIAALVAMHNFPYKTASDFWRDAATHRLHDLAQRSEDDPTLKARLEEFLSWLHAEHALRRYREELDWFDHHFAEVESLIDKGIEMGDVEGAQERIDEERERAADWREPFGSRMYKLLNGCETRLQPLR